MRIFALAVLAVSVLSQAAHADDQKYIDMVNGMHGTFELVSAEHRAEGKSSCAPKLTFAVVIETRSLEHTSGTGMGYSNTFQDFSLRENDQCANSSFQGAEVGYQKLCNSISANRLEAHNKAYSVMGWVQKVTRRYIDTNGLLVTEQNTFALPWLKLLSESDYKCVYKRVVE